MGYGNQTSLMTPANDHAYLPLNCLLVLMAASATSHKIVLIILFPFRVRPLLHFPALSLLPGHSPAHEAISFMPPNLLMSSPISAISVAALISLTPGSVCSVCQDSFQGSMLLWWLFVFQKLSEHSFYANSKVKFAPDFFFSFFHLSVLLFFQSEVDKVLLIGQLVFSGV